MAKKGSVVDYLKSRKRASDFLSRRVLWSQLDPRQRYTGSLAQNTRLLNALQLGWAAPELEFISSLVPIGGEINARVLSDSKVLIENGLSHTSMNADPMETVLLGTAEKLGLVPLHIQNEDASSFGQLVMRPRDGQVLVDWVSTPVETTEDTFMIEVADPTLVVLLAQFADNFQDVAGEAAALAAKEMANAVNVSEVLIDVFAGIVVVLATGGGGTFLVAGQVAGYTLEYAVAFMNQAVDLALPSASSDDRDKLKKLFTAILTIPRIGLSVINIRRAGKEITQLKKNHQLCASIVELQSFGDWTVEQFKVDADNKAAQVAGSLIRNSVKNMTSIVCAAQPKK